MATTKQKDNIYGYDMSLFLDIRKNASATSGRDLVINDLVGRLVDFDLWYSDDYGINLEGLIRSGDVRQFGSIATSTETELLRDDRIISVKVTISDPDVDGIVNVSIAGVLSSEESFSLIGNLNLFQSSQFNFRVNQ